MFSNGFNWYRANAATLLAVVVLSTITVELLHRRLRRRRVEPEELATSITSAFAFIAAKTILAKLAISALALHLFDHHRLLTLDLTSPWIWIGVFLVRDIVYYWVHRAEHRIRVLWASHLVHHSPETINYATAVRVPWMEAVYKPWLGLWVPMIGFHPLAFIALDVFAAVIGQLCHTESVRRVPVLEHVMVTPSTHRVHHGSNPEYIDKNFGAVLIVWDKLFGTYEAECAPVVYGIGADKRIETPTDALVGGYPHLVTSMRELPSWSQRARFALAPPS